MGESERSGHKYLCRQTIVGRGRCDMSLLVLWGRHSRGPPSGGGNVSSGVPDFDVSSHLTPFLTSPPFVKENKKPMRKIPRGSVTLS